MSPGDDVFGDDTVEGLPEDHSYEAISASSVDRLASELERFKEEHAVYDVQYQTGIDIESRTSFGELKGVSNETEHYAIVIYGERE